MSLCNKLFATPNAAREPTTIPTVGSLDLIFKENVGSKTTSINPKLCYKAISETTPYEQILKDIKAIDTNNEFYYNMPIAGNIDIDMNPNDEKDTLENPLN